MEHCREMETVEYTIPHPHPGLDYDHNELDDHIKAKVYKDDVHHINDCMIFSNPDLDVDVVLQNASKLMEEVYKPKEWAESRLQKIKADAFREEIIVQPNTVKVHDSTISMTIELTDKKTGTLVFYFFQDGIFKVKCINPVYPSKFSFEQIEKPANLTSLNISNNVKTGDQQLEVELPQALIKVIVNFKPFSISVVSTNEKLGTLFEVNPNQTLKFDKNIGADFRFHTPYVYGIPERAYRLLLDDTKQGLPFRLYNNDLFGYPTDSRQALYGSAPILTSRRTDSPTYVSLYWQNCSETYIDVHKVENKSDTHWLSERGNLEFYVWVNYSTKAHYASLAHIAGKAAMPQYFTLGYHQCRYSYNDEQDLLHVNEKFNEHEIPCDSVTLDIDHTDGFRYLTWDKEMFPDPEFIQELLGKDGRKLICIGDPHIKVADDYHIYKGAIENGYVILNKNKQPFVGVCFPGKSVWMDYMYEDARDYWSKMYSYEVYKHSTPLLHAWNDMNEPSVFEYPDKAMPKENFHKIKSKEEPQGFFHVEHREVHNIYGYCMHKGTYNGLLRRNPDENIRPHVLSRAFYVGSQKFATIWTGDTMCSWDHLKYTIPMMLSMAICGISATGGDVGGFLGNPEPELTVRWSQLGTFMPFFRAHCDKRYDRREPWMNPPHIYHMIEDSIKERYRMIAYWYTAYEEHCRTGIPLIRPVWLDLDVIDDSSVMGEDVRFIVGDSMLVAPVTEAGITTLKKPLKGLQGRWYDYYDKKQVTQDEDVNIGMERIGVFLKGGSVVPIIHFKNMMKSSKMAKEGNIFLYIAVDEKETAVGRMYFDDGETFDFKKGAFSNKTMLYYNNVLRWEDAGNFGYVPQNRVTKLVFMGLNREVKSAHLIKHHHKHGLKVHNHDNIVTIDLVALAKEDWRVVLDL